jgi:hypothetical protein
LNFIFSYTFSRLMDNNTTSLINTRKYRAVSPQDQKHVARFAFTYQLPFSGANTRKALKYTLGGWSIAGFGDFATGVPLSVTHAFGRPLRTRNPALSGPISERLGDRVSGGRAQNPYFDTGAFIPLADQYVITPEPPTLDELRAPGPKTMSASLFKFFPITETKRIEFRLEATGVTNSPNFGAPGTNLSQLGTFGIIQSAGGNRAMQFSLRFSF